MKVRGRLANSQSSSTIEISGRLDKQRSSVPRSIDEQIGKAGEHEQLYPGLPSHHCGRSGPGPEHPDQICQRPCAIFRMALPRCTLTVISATPSLPAICLFIRPAATSAITSCSRAVKDLKRPAARPPASAAPAARDPARVRAERHRADPGHETAWSGTPPLPPSSPLRHRDVAMAGDENDRK